MEESEFPGSARADSVGEHYVISYRRPLTYVITSPQQQAGVFILPNIALNFCRSAQNRCGFGGIRFPHVKGFDSLSLKDYLISQIIFVDS